MCNLIPFIVKRSMSLFSENIIKVSNNLIFPFVYKLNKKGLIPNDKLKNELGKCFIKNSFYISWVLPELIEFNSSMKSSKLIEDRIILDYCNNSITNSKNPKDTIYLYYPCNSNNMEVY